MQYPMLPEYRPSQPKRRRWLWFSLVGCLSLLAIGIGAICALGTPAFMQGYHNGQATSTAESHTATASSQAHNPPRMGGTLDDFVAAYGLPTKTAPDNETFASDTVQITAYVNGTTVNRIFIVGLSTWTVYATLAYCKLFLPADAVLLTNAVGDRVWIDYSSNSMGKIVMQLQTPTCLLFVSP